MSEKNLPKVAYFCMEYGLDSSLKTYAGGLGILAGDYIKGAKDHGYPMVALGIRWKQGYTDQHIDEQGKPYDAYHNYEYDFLEDTGVTVSVTIRRREVQCKVWKLEQFGHIPLYLLDTDIPGNSDRWICGQLYGWFGEERIAQEMVLGVGGVRALRQLGIDVDVYHFNEGHALFAGFELLREKTEAGASYEEALAQTREEVVFTTHTPVLQGNESHPIDRIMYMGADMGLTKKQLKKLGGEPFNMTVGALRLSRISNAVAQLHGQTANDMWAHIENRSEIIAITNCIHLPTWVDQQMIDLAQDDEGDLWSRHQHNKRETIEYIAEQTGVRLAEDKLLIGFSRRFAPYKRANLIFQKPEVIAPYLEDGRIQIVFAGKAHPLDDTGKGLIEQIVAMARKYPQSVVFVENYDMHTGRALTRGSDIWLNNPRRPKEASGTSGMKAAMNGVLNCSILDGWWPEACRHGENGWQFGDGFESEDLDEQDAHDLDALYEVLLDEVLPTYYDNRTKWVDMMRQSIVDTHERFAVKRMLEDYYGRMYTGKG